MTEHVITHTGKLGDFLYALPVGSWLYKQTGRKVHYVLPRCFGPFQYITPLLRQQEHVSRVTLVEHQILNYDCGGQPYVFSPRDHGVECAQYYNFGFRSYPSRFIPGFYADEYGLEFDPEFRLQLGERACRSTTTGELLRSSESGMAYFAPDYTVPLPTAVDLLALARRLKAAAEFHTWFNGLAVLCWLAGIDATVYRVPGHAPLELYFPEPRTLTFREVTR